MGSLSLHIEKGATSTATEQLESVRVSPESSEKEYQRLLKYPKRGPAVAPKPMRPNPYDIEGKAVVALVHSRDRRSGIREAMRLIGGLKPICRSMEGQIVIKPNCNTDAPFPRNTHPETVRVIAEGLIEIGFPPNRILVGDMSGRYRGLPTCHTMTNMGLKKVADDLGIQISYFDEEDWVTVRHPKSRAWPDGIKIPRLVYEASGVILTPIMRPHIDATFTMSLKLGVGLIDAVGREWLHNGEAFYEKMVELNLTFSTDLVVVDGLKCFIDRPSNNRVVAEPGVIIASGNRVAADAVGASIMKQFGAYGMTDHPVIAHKQFTLAEDLGLGKPGLDDIVLRTSDLVEDEHFPNIVAQLEADLS